MRDFIAGLVLGALALKFVETGQLKWEYQARYSMYRVELEVYERPNSVPEMDKKARQIHRWMALPIEAAVTVHPGQLTDSSLEE
jgi:hypothetical protein